VVVDYEWLMFAFSRVVDMSEMTIEMSNFVPEISFHEKITRIHLIYWAHQNACHSTHVVQP